MYRAKSTLYPAVLLLMLLPVLLQGCVGSVQYRATPGVRAGIYADILNFSDSEITPRQVDALYRDVARVMRIVPDRTKPRPQIVVVPPAQIHEDYLRLHHSAKSQDGIALALFIPHANRILIPRYDRTLLTHELAHYFTFHYLSAPRSDWEAIADKVVDAVRSAG